MKFGLAAATLLLIGLLAGPCRAADDSLYRDLGGREGISRIVDRLSDLYLTDDRIRLVFDNLNIERLKGMLTDQFCVLAGGPCTYKGRAMKEVHKGLHITNAEFNALVEDLEIAMDRENVGFGTQARLLAILAPMQHDVVTR